MPAFNEQESIAQTLKSIKAAGDFSVVVVDDGSTDFTSRIAKKHGARVIRLTYNRGVGWAFNKGLEYAIKNNFNYSVQLDADGQHNPEDIPRLAATICNGKADMVLGSRFIKKSNYVSSPLRLVAIYLLRTSIYFRTGKQIHDPTSGFRMLNRKTMQFVHQRFCGHCPEATVVTGLLINQFRVTEVPVEMKQRFAGKSKLTLIKGIVCFVKNVWGISIVH